MNHFNELTAYQITFFPPYLLLALRSLELRASRLLISLEVWFKLNIDLICLVSSSKLWVKAHYDALVHMRTIVPTDGRSFMTSPEKILEDWSFQDLKISKRTCKDLFFDPGDIIRFFKMNSLEFWWQIYLIPLIILCYFKF